MVAPPKIRNNPNISEAFKIYKIKTGT